MKKNILTILLAGLLTMSAISCANNPSTNPNNTGDPTSQTSSSGTTNNNQDPPIVNPPESDYTTVDETVYAVVKNLNLRTSASTSDSALANIQLPFGTELHRTKYNSTWSKVTYNGTEYYVASVYLTRDDINAKHFTAITPKEMYATDAVKVRLYPSTHTELSKREHIIKTLKKNDAVTVVATGSGWYQIRIDEKLYYVASKYLSDTKASGVESLGDYLTAFRNGSYTQPQTMFIATEEANVRLYPSFDNSFSTIVDTYQKGTQVTVIAQAMVNGKMWTQISVPNADDPAAPSARYYVSLDCLSATQGGSSLDLTQLLNLYTGFKIYPEEKTMYVTNDVENGLVIRISPSIPNAEPGSKEYYANCLEASLWPKAKTAITVSAYGTGDHSGWYIINYENGYYFVKANYLTTNANGTPVLTLEAVLGAYSTLRQCTETEMVILKDTNYYSAPSMKAEEKIGTYTTNDRVTVIAEGTVGEYGIYVIKGADGNCYFITSEPTNVAPVTPN